MSGKEDTRWAMASNICIPCCVKALIKSFGHPTVQLTVMSIITQVNI